MHAGEALARQRSHRPGRCYCARCCNACGVDWILETHVHADHLSAASALKRRLGCRTGIGAHIREVQQVFKQLYHLESEFVADGRQFDRLFADAEVFKVGSLDVTVLWVPGHTPADLAYQFGDDAVFVGDTLFMPDAGTARADFPGDDAALLYRSIGKLLALPDATRLYVCHDYPHVTRAYWYFNHASLIVLGLVVRIKRGVSAAMGGSAPVSSHFRAGADAGVAARGRAGGGGTSHPGVAQRRASRWWLPGDAPIELEGGLGTVSPV